VPASEFLFHREDLNIYLFPKAIQPNSHLFDERCFFAGRCAGEQPYYGSWRRTYGGDRPIALVATSTTYIRGPEFFRMCIQALSGLQWHVLLSIGDGGDPERLGPLPPHFEVVQRTAHVKILPYATLFVCLGGIVTTAEALYHGLPLLVTSHGYPELEWQGENLTKLGIGIHLRSANTSVASIREAALQLTSDASIRNSVERMRHAVRREPGSEDAANRIEDYLNERAGTYD
jgi:MGT family glycosyltransferase